ncbi:LOW QUALITY PROTEIN: protein spaetzle 4-like [Portunus trituberculatus]|uniref:LOW QUALITY PROTEIN: protein spaetzle 4-like n=1 Tax=Portunus trituberculatus TaxID=210409 RepID=UPI001E1D0564|nr:LOW QUALITY PROTEIN: protein spaetzle 4-like [Portunus trituberculatus]
MTTPLYRLLPALTAWWVSVGVAWANYDEYMTCGSSNERHGRHYHQPELPCDLSKDSWCESPGNQYPWGSVRRFVYENQGLMKRMYGNQRHYSVLRAELLNDLYDEMFDEMIKRISKPQHPSAASPSSKSARYRKPSHPAINTHDLKAGDKRPHNGRAMKVTIQPQYSSVRRQHAAPRPKARPNGRRKVAGTSRLRVSAQTQGTTTSTTATTSSSSSSSPSPSTPKRTTATTSTSTSPITVSEVQPTTTTTTVTTGDDALTTTTLWGEEGHVGMGTAASSHATDHLFEEETQATLLPPEDEDWESTWTTLSDPSSTDPSSAFPTVFSGDQEESYASFTAPETSSPAPPTTQHDLSLGAEGEDEVEVRVAAFSPRTSTPSRSTRMTSRPSLGERLEEEGTDYDKDEIDLGIEEVLNEDKRRSEGSKQTQEQAEVKSEDLKAETRQQVDELRVDGNMKEEVKVEMSTPETVRIRKPVKGINACPVEEEFVAPYWANNTQGKTLALLNQYPFEQYIQWERCKHEHRQWYCRHGCRCEQQYRLHKLLAFDPTNECRGIFSDWFRFPSFCVCKCYNLHLFTSSSRMGRLNLDDDGEDYDEEYDDYFDEEEEEEEDYELEELEELIEEEEEEEEAKEQEPEQKEERVRKEEEEQNNSYYYYRSRPSSPLANIPPQRRPRPPQRPYSHISPPSHTLEAPSHTFTPPSSQPLPATPAPETTTLGTLDAATPHYYYNLTNYARILLGKGQPLGLSRVPRSPGE